MRLYLASANAHKAAEFQALASGDNLALEIVSAEAAGGMPAVNEDTGTFEGNARKKAYAFQGKVPKGSWVIADDSGLCVDALEGQPGVESAYYAGAEGDGAANLRKLIEALRHVPEGKRGAHFVCVLVVLDPAGTEHVFVGRCEGALLRAPRGAGGFGYDPLFIPRGSDATLAEMSAIEKNAVSHRARAWQELARWWRVTFLDVAG